MSGDRLLGISFHQTGASMLLRKCKDQIKECSPQREEEHSKQNPRTVIGFDSLKGGMKCEG